MSDKGICREHNREFVLIEGCPECLAVKTNIVKVRYYSETTGEASDREYTYFAEDQLQVGDVIIVPARDTTAKAKVSAINVPEIEIEKFRDKVKMIPTRLSPMLGEIEAEAREQATMERLTGLGEDSEELTPEEELDQAPFLKQVEEDIGAVEPMAETALILRPGEDIEVHGYYKESMKLLKYAKDMVIATGEDAKVANDDLVVMSRVKKFMEDKRKGYLTPLKEQEDAIRATYDYLMEHILAAYNITRAKLTAFKVEQVRIAKEAEEVNRQAMEVARKQAALNNGEFTVDLTPVVPQTAPKLTRTDLGTSGLVDNWKYRIVNLALLPREYMMPDDVMLKATATKYHADKVVEGVEFFNEPFVRTTR